MPGQQEWNLFLGPVWCLTEGSWLGTWGSLVTLGQFSNLGRTGLWQDMASPSLLDSRVTLWETKQILQTGSEGAQRGRPEGTEGWATIESKHGLRSQWSRLLASNPAYNHFPAVGK